MNCGFSYLKSFLNTSISKKEKSSQERIRIELRLINNRHKQRKKCGVDLVWEARALLNSYPLYDYNFINSKLRFNTNLLHVTFYNLHLQQFQTQLSQLLIEQSELSSYVSLTLTIIIEAFKVQKRWSLIQSYYRYLQFKSSKIQNSSPPYWVVLSSPRPGPWDWRHLRFNREGSMQSSMQS